MTLLEKPFYAYPTGCEPTPDYPDIRAEVEKIMALMALPQSQCRPKPRPMPVTGRPIRPTAHAAATYATARARAAARGGDSAIAAETCAAAIAAEVMDEGWDDQLVLAL